MDTRQIDKHLDKNGNDVEPGMKVRICQTHDDYVNPRIRLVRRFRHDLVLWDGQTHEFLSRYRNGDTNYHAVEIN